ncbi:hypothetical protein [Prosthecobacter vanneervenii]|uniref:Uncharacterized protein n=1 Tax=Prosthecobacter vanneervenii TaxID=48466 RepID=A0A7W8DKN0_9BACT|nr:hypothetical protein [Prosthecobacter vanneervenii]MBB5033393.1 hypothetical protein [Prosthecobacter vanneervenii]
MANPDNVHLAANFGVFMLGAGGLGLLSGTTLGRSGLIRRVDQPGAFYVTCCCHLAVGAFCYFGQYFVPAR